METWEDLFKFHRLLLKMQNEMKRGGAMNSGKKSNAVNVWNKQYFK